MSRRWGNSTIDVPTLGLELGFAVGLGLVGAALVIGYGRPAEHAFSAAVSRLCAALADPAALNRRLDE